MRKHNLAFIDIETTGLNVSMHEIIDIGCVISNPDLDILEEFEIKIKPQNLENSDPISMKVNKYKEEDWINAISLEEALNILSEKTKDCIMVGQNVCFDFQFLDFAFLKTKIKNQMHYHKLDTISIAWNRFHQNIEFNHFSLREMCKFFDIKNENPHTGLGDAKATYLLYKKLMEL